MSVVTFRTDDEVDAALAELEGSSRDRSQAIREAILLASRVKRAERVRAEAEALAADDADRAEARAVLADMDSVRAW